jgi:4a-hydroxytetrahydrobiopterin dehydratase
MSMRRELTEEELVRQLEGLPAWHRDGIMLRGRFDFPSFPALIRAVDEIALLAEELDHHPDLDIRWRTLHAALTTHSAGGLTQLDIESAHRIEACARAEGGRPE